MEKYMEALDIISTVNHIPALREGEGEKWLIILPKLSKQSFCFLLLIMNKKLII
jgi:hypothetical protein